MLTTLSAISFFFIPFLGGNHLSLNYFITIDRFWIETSFVLLLLVAVSLNFYKKKMTPAGFPRFMLFFLPFLIANTASLFYTWNRLNTLSELNTIVWIIGSVYLYFISEKKDTLLKALMLGAALSVVCMIIQYKILLPNLMEIFKDGKYSSVIKAKVVPFSSFLNEATLGGYFLFLIPLSIYFGVVQKKVLYMVMSSIIIFGLLFSLSRMGMVIGLLSILAGSLMIIRKRGLKRVVFLVIVILFALSLLLSVVYVGSKEKGSDFQDTAIDRVKKTPEHITTLTYRTITWKYSINAFLDKPLSGYGAGTFEYAYRKYYEATLYTKYAHNVLIKIAVELGLLGLISFLFYLFGFVLGVKNIIRDTKDEDENNPPQLPPLSLSRSDSVREKGGEGGFSGTKYSFIALSAISGFAFAVFNVTFEIPAYIVTFFILSSVFFTIPPNSPLSPNRIASGQVQRGVGGDSTLFPEQNYFWTGVKRGWGDLYSHSVIFLSVVIVLIGSFFFTTKANISKKLYEDGVIYEENGLLPQAFISHREAINSMPVNNLAYVGIVNVLLKSYVIERNMQQKKEIRNTIAECLRNIEQNPDKDSELFFLAGSMYSFLGNYEQAGSYFAKALRYYPSSGYYMFETANFYFLNGHTEKAKTLIKRMETYVDRHTGSEMHALYVYKMRDLESNIEYMGGNIQKALELAKRNLQDAEKDAGIIENILSREYIIKEPFIKHLRDKIVFYESKIKAKQ